MVCPRSVVRVVGLAVILAAFAFAFTSPALAQNPPPVPIERMPYSIRVAIDFNPSTRIDPARRAAILEEWRGLVRRFVGAPWVLHNAEPPGSLGPIPIDDLKAADLKGMTDKVDKVWVIQVRREGAGLAMVGRELDVATGWLGEVHRRTVAYPSDLPRDLLHLSVLLFSPSAEVGEQKGGGVSFLIRGGALSAASPMGEVAPVGTVFRALRIFPRDDGTPPEIIEVRYSYFRVEKIDGPVAFCEIIRGVGDPLTNRYARKNHLVALGIKPGSAPTRLRFLLKGDRQPAAGYRLIARGIPLGGKPDDLGMTDRDGRIVLEPGFASGLVSLRLLAGNDEPMLDVPVMPGETPDERTLLFEPRPFTLALEARLDALRDAIIDVVAIRSRLELRMKARVDGEDWAGLDEAIQEFRKLTPRDQFEARLKQIQEDGERRELESRTLVLTKNARAAIEETRALIGRYLDEEAIRSYEDAAQRARAELARPKSAKKAPG